MALRDYEAFIRQCANNFDPDLDVSVGSSFDTQVVQPILRRMGTDPFTVDLATFINDRLVQAFPTMATKEGDALTDLLVKPVTLLWDPIVREVKRVQQQLSLKDPTVLTLDEADALGANFFRPRTKGEYAKGMSRVLFTQPQNVTISPVNYFLAKGGLRFYPTRTQSIKTEEMLLNVYESYYYFDVNLIAEKPGTGYNIGPNEMQSVANLPAAVRVLNLSRFGAGEDEEDAVGYIDRVGQELGEKSMVALRGIAAKLRDAYPEMNRLNVVGFGDTEMKRDVLVGGGLGEVKAAGIAGSSVPDGEGKTYTRRFHTTEVDLTTIILGDATSWVLTVFGATGSVVLVQDFAVSKVVGANDIDLAVQEMRYGSTALRWTLRKKEITLSSIPGGILFPNNATGTLSIPDDEVHIGGVYDIHTRGADFDVASLLVENVTDDTPLARGHELEVAYSGGGDLGVYLHDYVMGVDYSYGDETYQHFADAARLGFALQILEGVDAGTYRVLEAEQADSTAVFLKVDPLPTNVTSTRYHWRMFDEINIDLIDPKETRIEGTDLRTVQGSTDVTTGGGVNFDEYGVAEGDVLRILNGYDAGDYGVVADPLAPSYDWIRLDRELTHSQSDLQYIVFRPNKAGGIELPLVRLTSIELLDSSKQPLGSKIPYGKPVDIQSRSFQNPRRGIKHDLSDVRLGLVSQPATLGTFAINIGDNLSCRVYTETSVTIVTVTFTVGTPTVAQVVADINSAFSAFGYYDVAVAVGVDRVGLRPATTLGTAVMYGTAMIALFGSSDSRSTADIMCDDIADWGALDPALDMQTGLDVVQVLDGSSVGYYAGPFTTYASGLILRAGEDVYSYSNFPPEVGRRVQLGSRSIGSARMYFLEPTSIEVDANTRFTVEYDNHTLSFLPDPTLDYQGLPALPSAKYSGDGACSGGSLVFSSAASDFVKSGVRVGDKLVLLTHPIAGDISISTDPVPGVALKTFIFSLDGGPDRTLTFIRDDASLSIPAGEVTKQGVVDQINAALGQEIAEYTALDTIQFSTELPLVIRSTGTANSVILGNVAGTTPPVSFSAADVNNESPFATNSLGNDYYEVTDVGPTTLTITPAFASAGVWADPVTDQYFQVLRTGVQRISTTQMSGQTAEASLYYFDVELVSEGTGDVWNIPASLQMTATGYRADGYWLTTDDENLSFSTVEKPKLVMSRTILENGVDDDPQNATQLSGQNIQLNYERADLVANIQSFASSETERVVCANPLSRHLIPHFVRYDFYYTGGSKESVVIPDMEKYIKGLFPMDALESSDLQKIAMDRGATSIRNPIDIIAVVHYPDRSVYVVRSQDSITTGRLAAFIPDALNVVRSVA